MEPEISVVMATYKQPQWLPQAILSVVPQIKYPGQLKIIGVMSDRESVDLLESYFELLFTLSPGKMIYGLEREAEQWHQKQRGLYEVRTEYVTFFDSDDVMLPGWLEKGMRVARQNVSRGKIPIVAPSYRMVDVNLNKIQDVILPEFSIDNMMNGSIIPDFSITTTEAMKSIGGCFDPDGYDPGYVYHPYTLWLRMLKKYKNQIEVRLLPEIGFLYRQHKGGLHKEWTSTKRRSKQNTENEKQIARHYFPDFKPLSLGEGTMRKDGTQA